MDEKILKKAIELADGWEHNGRGYYHSNFRGKLVEMGQVQKDALAAQLVRQVDALDDREYVLYVSRNNCWVDDYTDWLEGGVIIKEVVGKDRTEGTLTLVVESKVLEKGKGK